jgi:hypothetical protein
LSSTLAFDLCLASARRAAEIPFIANPPDQAALSKRNIGLCGLKKAAPHGTWGLTSFEARVIRARGFAVNRAKKPLKTIR